jgi:hypothetical protein
MFSQTAPPARKRILAWGDATTAYQHDSISHALATIERLGRESGAFDTYIRTDSQIVTKQPIPEPARNTRNDAITDAVLVKDRCQQFQEIGEVESHSFPKRGGATRWQDRILSDGPFLTLPVHTRRLRRGFTSGHSAATIE